MAFETDRGKRGEWLRRYDRSAQRFLAGDAISRCGSASLALSAAFLVTALSEGRAFAEVVPAELLKRTLRPCR
jgi:hypothetical protein